MRRVCSHNTRLSTRCQLRITLIEQALQSDRFELMAYDFFTPQPVKGQSAQGLSQRNDFVNSSELTDSPRRSSILLPKGLPRLARHQVCRSLEKCSISYGARLLETDH